ncbi:hypothetical protein [Campylobacter sp. MG1]|uniref:hypothetical protein n=1 Tax=Campylobacter sp. MG1 TaxID=2976332 RepID=UPI00226CA933|nr:hypothetical protein [Campylobacter sp. MG1]
MKEKIIIVDGQPRVVGKEILNINDFIKLLNDAKEKHGENIFVVSQYRNKICDYKGYDGISVYDLVEEHGNTFINLW